VKKKLASLPATSPTAAPTTPVKSTGPKK
jgi:hypothetical protein